MSEKKKVRASLETPAYLFIMPLLALCAFAMVYDGIKHGGQLFAGFLYGLPIVAGFYGMIISVVKEYTEQSTELILEEIEKAKADEGKEE